MADSNNERVGKALEILRDGLRPFVAAAIDAALTSGTLDERELQRFIAENRLSPHPEEWDVLALLLFMQRFWMPVFAKSLDRDARNFVGELIGHRNKWAHQELFSADDAYRTVDSALRLLEAIKAPQVASVQPIKTDLFGQLNAEQTRTPIQSKARYCTEGCPCYGRPKTIPRVCPLCGKDFKVGWTGIDGHYNGRKHESITGIDYQQWWNSICEDHGGPGRG